MVFGTLQNDIIDHEGVLEKKGPNTLHAYKKRRCILSGKKLKYYEETDGGGGNPKNEIDLCTMIDVQLANSENPGQLVYPFTLYGPTTDGPFSIYAAHAHALLLQRKIRRERKMDTITC